MTVPQRPRQDRPERFVGISNPGTTGKWVPVATVERVAAERDRYKDALERIAERNYAGATSIALDALALPEGGNDAR